MPVLLFVLTLLAISTLILIFDKGKVPDDMELRPYAPELKEKLLFQRLFCFLMKIPYIIKEVVLTLVLVTYVWITETYKRKINDRKSGKVHSQPSMV